MSKSRRIDALLRDQDFLSIFDDTREALTKKVMNKSTSDEERRQVLAEYHAMDTLLAKLRSHAQNAKETE